MKQLPISAIYLVKNEEQFLELSLGSVRPYVSEVIVVDTGSTDKTLEIAERLGIQCHHYHWNNDFSAARNFAATKATKEWIFFVDGDEIVDESFWPQLQLLINNPSIHSIGVLQRNYSDDSQLTGWQPFKKSQAEGVKPWRDFQGYVDNIMYKIYRNHLGIEWSGVVHETIIHSCRKKGLHWQESSLLLHHLKELKPRVFQEAKKSYYHALALEKLKQEPWHENSWYEMAVSYVNQGQFLAAEGCLERALSMRAQWPEVQLLRAQVLLRLEKFSEAELLARQLLRDNYRLEEVIAVLSTAVLYQGKWSDFTKVIEVGAEVGVNHPHFHVNAATYYFETKDFHKAHSHLEKAYQGSPSDPFIQASLTKVRHLMESSESRG